MYPMTKNSLYSKLASLGKTDICSVTVSPKAYSGSLKKLLKVTLIKKDHAAVYISLNKPCSSIMSLRESLKISEERLHVLDATGGMVPKKKPNRCSFTSSGVRSLTELSIAITKAINSGKYSVVILDSVSTLRVYHSPEVIEKFIHFLVTKLRQLALGGVLIAVTDSQTKDMIPVISQFCDVSIEL